MSQYTQVIAHVEHMARIPVSGSGSRGNRHAPHRISIGASIGVDRGFLCWSAA